MFLYYKSSYLWTCSKFVFTNKLAFKSMRKITLFILCACLVSPTIYAQHAETYEIEKLDKAQAPLRMEAPGDFLRKLDGKEFVKFSLSEPLVEKGTHPVICGYLQAYQEHRPITLSPDIAWLLICQGFAQHVNNNAEKLRQKFVNFKGQKTLEVVREVSEGNLQTFPWETVFPEFVEKIKNYVGEELTGTLAANFTTTTPTSLIASQITIMDAMKTYFKYKVFMIGCGIPEVTIEGSLEDWEKIQKRLDVLEKYELEWWTKELRPVIQEIINAKSGKFDKKFWKEMIRFHKEGFYGSLTDIDGWFLKFYPYLSDGKRSSMKAIDDVSLLPKEMVAVPFEFEIKLSQNTPGKKMNMEFWAGFMGLSQDSRTYSLKPEIGWAVNIVTKTDDSAPIITTIKNDIPKK